MARAELSGGALIAGLANELGKLIADSTGRGAQRSRAFLHQDVVICVLEDGATNAEKNLAAAERPTSSGFSAMPCSARWRHS